MKTKNDACREQNDLRSAIVKEACVLLEKLSSAAGNYMAALMRDMLNVLLQLLANGNSVRRRRGDGGGQTRRVG